MKEGGWAMNRIIEKRRTGFLALVALGALTLSAGTASAGVNRWTSSGPVAGVRCVAIDPMNPGIVYAGTSRSGVFKSSNGGLSWGDPSSGELDGISVHSLAVDPQAPSSVYAGTPSGVLKSTDGGATWSDKRLAGAIYNLVFGSQKSTIYAADFDDGAYYPGPSAVYRSTDDGETWSRRVNAFAIIPGTLVVDPTQPSTLYAATSDSFGVYKSVDAGSTWRAGSGVTGFFVTALAIDPRDPSTLYAGTYFGILKSVDAGSTWRVASSDLNGYSVTALAIDPREPSTLYAGTYRGVFRSTDGGASWRDFNTGLTRFDVATLAIDRTGTRLHAGSRTGGVFDYQIFSGALDLSVGSDNRASLLFADLDGRAVIRTIDSSGNSFSGSPYGPYSGWSPRAVADGSDGLTRVLWNNLNVDGSAALWLVGPEGNGASYRLGAGAGWTAVDVAASIPGTTHLLWTDTDGRIALWSVDNAGPVSTGTAYGPYPGWIAVAIADGQDGLTRVLWNRVDGSAALSFFGPEGLRASYRFGPGAGWTAADVAVGADGQTRILWTHGDGRIALWRVDSAGSPTALGPTYPPPPGFTAGRIAAGPDGLTRVLWTGANGTAVLWIMSADNVFQKSISLGPDAVGGIAGAWKVRLGRLS
jgi:photosystem II stability/assembly factor-like uncharacterized protein